MKRTFLLFALSFVVFLNVKAESAIKQAMRMAQQFMQEKNIEIYFPEPDSLAPAPYYIFNAKDNRGFVIVSGLASSESILAYSDKGNLRLDNLPDNLRWWLDCYEKMYQIQSTHSLKAPEEQKERHTVSPLIKTKWGQRYPYNTLCPYIDNQQCITGCVATAMAQLMNYYNYPKSSKATYPYRTVTAKIQMGGLPAVDFNWDAMLDVYDNASSEESRVAVSTLMFYCGCAINMDYGVESSGADVTPVCDAMPYFFDYDESSKKIYRKDYHAEDWEQLIYESIEKGMPVFYSGDNGQENGGHAFLCDGYDRGFFHVNWGWDGLYNGFFKLLPDTENYGDTDFKNEYINNQMAVVMKPKGFNGIDTSIDNPRCLTENTKIYSLTGTIMNDAKSNSHHYNLPKGIYIMNRKKVIVH